MTCRCTVNTLSLFIRNVAQVDVPSSSKYATRRLQRSTRNGTSAFPGSFVSSRPYSSVPSEDGKSEPRNKESRKSSIAEFSMDAIDSILAESPIQTKKAEPEKASGYETPLKSLLKDMPQKKPREDWTVKKSENARTFTPRDAPPSGADQVVRRTRGTGNTGLTIHFDNPRAPPRAPRRDPELGNAMYRSRSPLKESDRQQSKDDWVPPPREPWMAEKDRVKEKYPDGYKPLKKLSPDAMAGIRALHTQMPEFYTTWRLSQEFEMSPESIRRILKSKWSPNAEEETERQKRWFKRGESVWTRYAELGIKPPKKWRELGIGNGKPEWMLRKQLERVQQDRPGPPALVTTARRTEQKYGSGDEAESSLADKIL